VIILEFVVPEEVPAGSWSRESELLLASDASAIVRHTNQVIYLKDNNLIELCPDGFNTTTLDNHKINPEIQMLDWDASSLAKGGFEHFMLKEIFEQPETIENAMRGRLLVEDGTARLDGLNLVLQELRGIKRLIFVACGTSWHAALVGEYMIEDIAGIPVEVDMLPNSAIVILLSILILWFL
jgi:glucosamine--fructose-6-phosphate aminotransferase (isomerizing)